MKSRLISYWLLPFMAVAFIAVNQMAVTRGQEDCKEAEFTNPLSTKCDECHLLGTIYFTCETPGNPAEKFCTKDTIQDV